MDSHLQVGVSRANITPPAGISQANWGAQAHERARGIDLDLWATALALHHADTTMLTIDLDLVGLDASTATEVLQAVTDLTGVPTAQIRLAYTHTHSGPTIRNAWVLGGAEMVEPYLASLPGKIAGVAWQALNDLQPARMAAGSGLSDIAVNRRFITPEGAVVVGRNGDGPVDHEVQVVRFDTLAEEPLAILVHYACHPIIVGPYNDLITPDYPGVVKRTVEAATGATCLFLQGAAGDIGPIDGCTSEAPLPIYRRLGEKLGYAAVQVALGLQPFPKQESYVKTLESGASLAVYAQTPLPEATPEMRVCTRTINLPLKVFTEPEAAQAEALQRRTELQAIRQSGTEEEIRWATMLAKRAERHATRATLYAGQSHTSLPIQVLVLNGVAIVAIPGEPFVEIGLAIKAGSPFKQTLFSGYSNVGSHYIPTPDAHAVGGYEVESTPYAPEAATVIIDETLALLHELKG